MPQAQQHHTANLPSDALAEKGRAMLDAAVNGKWDEVGQWLDDGVPLTFSAPIRGSGAAPASLMSAALSKCDPEALAMLVDRGWNLQSPCMPEGMTPLHWAVQYSVQQSTTEHLLALGADPHHPVAPQGLALRETLPPSIGNLPVVNLLWLYEQTPRFSLATMPTEKEALFTVNQYGKALADHPRFWQQLPQVNARLQEAGEAPVGREDLLCRDHQDGNATRLQRVLRLRRHSAPDPEINGIIEGLEALGEMFRLEDFLTPEGKASPLTEAFVQSKAVAALCVPEVWRNQGPEQFRDFYHALPENGRAQIDNFQSMVLFLERQEQARNPVQGRAG